MAHESLAPCLACPKCGAVGLVCSEPDEYAKGLGGALKWWCPPCEEITLSTPLCRDLPKASKARGPGMSESTARMTLGAANAGIGETQAAQLLCTMGLPQVRGTTYAKADDRVTAAIASARDASLKRARDEERRLALERGAQPDADGRVPIAGGYDMGWATRGSGKSYKSLSGDGTFMGSLSGKVLDSQILLKACRLCTLGKCTEARCNKNYTGSAGGMEGVAGADILCKLSTEDTGLKVTNFCTDLDAKTNAQVHQRPNPAALALTLTLTLTLTPGARQVRGAGPGEADAVVRPQPLEEGLPRQRQGQRWRRLAHGHQEAAQDHQRARCR